MQKKTIKYTSDDVEFEMEAKFLLGGGGGSAFSFISFLLPSLFFAYKIKFSHFKCKSRLNSHDLEISF